MLEKLFSVTGVANESRLTPLGWKRLSHYRYLVFIASIQSNAFRYPSANL